MGIIMRLIDADKLREHYNVVDPSGTFTYCSSILQEIDDAPTVAAIPVDVLRIRCVPGAEQAFDKRMFGCLKIVPVKYRDDSE